MDNQTWRLMGFDTPETFQAKCEHEYRIGTIARHMLQQYIDAGKDVRIEDSGRIDKYKRRLGTLIIDGKDVAEIMTSESIARPYHGGKREGWCKS